MGTGRLLASASRTRPGGRDEVEFDVGSFAQRLLLFDENILHSIRLLEIPHLVRLFGVGQVIDLLASRAVRIHLPNYTFGSIGHSAELRQGRPPLPLSDFSVRAITNADRRASIHRYLDACRDIPGVRFKEEKRLRREVAAAVVAVNPQAPDRVMQATRDELRRGEAALADAVVLSLAGSTTRRLDSTGLRLRVEFLDGPDLRVESNLQSMTGLDDEQVHTTLKRALLAVAGRNQRLAEMEHFGALIGLREDEAVLVQKRLEPFADSITDAEPRQALSTVLRSRGLPDLSGPIEAGVIDLRALLKLRQHPDIEAFRTWLWRNPDRSEDDLGRALSTVQARVDSLLGHRPVELLSWALLSVLGLLVPAVSVLGSAGAFREKFLTPPPTTERRALLFMNNRLPTLFRDQ